MNKYSLTIPTLLLCSSFYTYAHADKIIELSSGGGNSSLSKSTHIKLQSNPNVYLDVRNPIAIGAVTAFYQAGYSNLAIVSTNNKFSNLSTPNNANTGLNQVSQLFISTGVHDFGVRVLNGVANTFYTRGLGNTMAYALATGKPVSEIILDVQVWIQPLNQFVAFEDVPIAASTQ